MPDECADFLRNLLVLVYEAQWQYDYGTDAGIATVLADIVDAIHERINQPT